MENAVRVWEGGGRGALRARELRVDSRKGRVLSGRAGPFDFASFDSARDRQGRPCCVLSFDWAWSGPAMVGWVEVRERCQRAVACVATLW